MSLFSVFLRSLLLTSFFSFTAPIVLIGGTLGGLGFLQYFPGCGILGQIGFEKLLTFLRTFGSGYPLQGLFVIGLTCSLVGGLFDVYTCYRYQKLRD